MTKYDCSTKSDFIHERKRLCERFTTCNDCPFKFLDGYCQDIDSLFDAIPILQEWSDTHEEEPILTRKERSFIEYFIRPESTSIIRDEYGLFVKNYYSEDYTCPIYINETLFPFIKEGESFSIENLLEYEVEGE